VKEASDERIVKIISGIGVPVLIASDTHPSAHFVQKVGARFDVKVFTPPQSMTRTEKRAISQGIDDPHIRDAYAAAVKAYRRYQNRLRQIEAMDVKSKEELKKRVIVGERIAESLGKC